MFSPSGAAGVDFSEPPPTLPGTIRLVGKSPTPTYRLARPFSIFWKNSALTAHRRILSIGIARPCRAGRITLVIPITGWQVSLSLSGCVAEFSALFGALRVVFQGKAQIRLGS